MWIVGFTGTAQAAPVLLDGLAKLEYRGYDSAGMAVENAAGKIEVVKAKGRLKVLREMTDGGKAVPGSCGIGHTRWATHGEPSVVNAHPHYSRDQKIAVVHNGIIENYLEIKERLTTRALPLPRRPIPRSWPSCWTTTIPAPRPATRWTPSPA